MIVWTLLMLALVLAIKYYTSQELRKLEHRLKTVKEGLKCVKEKLQDVHQREDEARNEEAAHTARIRAMKEIIHDIDFRLKTPQVVDKDGLHVSDSMPLAVT